MEIKIVSQNIDFERLMTFAQKLYPTNCIRQQQSESFNRAYLHAVLIAEENNEIWARLAIYDNPNWVYEGKRVLTIGNYEAIDNPCVANAILSKAQEIATSLGGEILLGPMNGSTWDSHRFSADHDSANFFMEPYHHLYYTEHFVNQGFTRFATYFSSKDTQLIYDNPAVLARKAALLAQGLSIRKVEVAHFRAELERLHDFNEVAFQKNFLYTPIEKTAFVEKYMPIQKWVHPDFVILAEDRHQKLLGYFFCVPDFYNRNEKSLVVKTIARHPDKIWYGLGHVLGNEICRNAVKQGYQSIIHAFIYDAGFSTTITKSFSGERYKNYYLFSKQLGTQI